MRALTLTLALAAATGCGWEHLPDQGHVDLQAPLWDPSAIVPVPDGLLVPLPWAGKLAQVNADGTAEALDLGAELFHSLHPSPDPAVVGVLSDSWTCTLEDPRDARRITLLEECPGDARSNARSLRVYRSGALDAAVPVPPWLSDLAWSPNGRYAIGWVNLADEASPPSGVINLTSVQVLDIETGTLAPVTVGFAPDQVLYAADSARAVVLSQSRVAVIDLASSPPKTEVIFPLTLSADQVVTPIGVSLTPDGRYALIPVAGSSDLYVLDLESHSINLISMSSSASDVAVNALNDRTVVVFAGRAAVDLIDHAFFDVESIPLDEPMRHIIDLGEQDLLWSHTGPRDVYRLDVATGNVIEYRMQSAPSAVNVAPGGSHAVVFTAGSGSGALAGLPGMEIIDLQDDRGRSTPYLLESPGVAVAWNDEAAGVRAMILQADAEYVYDLDLITGAASELPLPAAPTGLWRVPGGGFAMSLDAAMGRVIFTDAAGVETGQAEGFALLGGLDRPTVTVEVE